MAEKNLFAIAAAIEVAPSLFVGGTLNIVSGNYSYSRTYRESDIQNRYQKFQSLTLEETIETDITGWNLKAALMYVLDDHFSLGISR
jgi:hypothetical protein